MATPLDVGFPRAPVPTLAPTPIPEPVAPEPVAAEPISFESFHQEAKNVLCFPNGVFPGVKFTFTKVISGALQLNHNLTFAAGEHSGYAFNPTFVLAPGTAPNSPPSDILLANVSGSGDLVGQYIHEFRSSTRLNGRVKAVSQASGKRWGASSVEGLYNGNDFSAFGKVMTSPNVSEIGLNYVQRFTNRLHLGAEFQLHREQGVMMSSLTFGGQYKTPHYTAAATLAPTGVVNVTYHQPLANRKVLVTAEMEVVLGAQHAVGTLGYQYNFRSSKLQGQINTKGVVAGLWEQQISPALSFSLSASIDHAEATGNVGVGLHVTA